jgi:hypothetical protein
MAKLKPADGHALSEQYPRVQRFYVRIMSSNNHSLRYQDDLWSFFQQCWHFKDWLKNDQNIPRSIREGIEKEIYRNRYIKICGDLANRSKHLKLTRKKKGKEIPHKGAKMVRQIFVKISDTVGRPEESKSSVSYADTVIRASGSQISVQELATKAMKQWEILLKRFGLLP